MLHVDAQLKLACKMARPHNELEQACPLNAASLRSISTSSSDSTGPGWYPRRAYAHRTFAISCKKSTSNGLNIEFK